MAPRTATQNSNASQAPQARTQPAPDLSALLEQVVANTQTPKAKAIRDGLKSEAALEKIESLLPPQMKGHAERLVNRALLTFQRRADLQEVTTASFMRCVVEAAELGLAIDGRLGHAVPFGNKVRDKDGKEVKDSYGKTVWQKEAQFMPDYKGLIAVARRNNLVRDCKADLVCENDTFRLYRTNGEDHLEHEINVRQPRGKVLGAYALLVLPDGAPHYEYMELSDLDRIRSKSKAKDSGPWVTDTNEMRRKTVVKRALKYFSEDPAIVRALELDDREYEPEAQEAPQQPSRPWRGQRPDMADPDAAAGQPEPPEPTPEQLQAEMARQDRRDDLAQQIGQAERAKDLEPLHAAIVADAELLGPAAEELLGLLEQRSKQLAG